MTLHIMKILLTGAGGQLGSEWRYQLSKKKNSNIESAVYNSSQLDVTNFEKVAGVIQSVKPDILINCAAYTKVDLAEKERQKAEQINASAVKNLADLCKKHAVKLIYYSTDYVFAGDKNDQKKFPEGYPEDHPAKPINRYGQTKWQGEQAVRSSGCEHLILRLSWLCGAYGSNFATTMLRLAKEHERVKVVNDQWGSPTFTRDVTEKTLRLIEQEREGTYHITSSGLITWAEFARAIFESSNSNVRVEPIPSSQFKTDAERPQFSKLNTVKIAEVEGVKIIDWVEGLKEMLNIVEGVE